MASVWLGKGFLLYITPVCSPEHHPALGPTPSLSSWFLLASSFWAPRFACSPLNCPFSQTLHMSNDFLYVLAPYDMTFYFVLDEEVE